MMNHEKREIAAVEMFLKMHLKFNLCTWSTIQRKCSSFIQAILDEDSALCDYLPQLM